MEAGTAYPITTYPNVDSTQLSQKVTNRHFHFNGRTIYVIMICATVACWFYFLFYSIVLWLNFTTNVIIGAKRPLTILWSTTANACHWAVFKTGTKKKIKLRFSGIEKWVIEWITTIIVTYSKARLYCVSCWVKPVSQNVASRKEVASLTQTNRLTSQFYCFSSGSVKFHTTSLTTLVIMTSETNYFSSLGKHNSTFG